jgi:hypothetical protein
MQPGVAIYLFFGLGILNEYEKPFKAFAYNVLALCKVALIIGARKVWRKKRKNLSVGKKVDIVLPEGFVIYRSIEERDMALLIQNFRRFSFRRLHTR